MRNWNFDSIHVAVRNLLGHFLGDVGGDLVPEKVEIDPRVGAPTFGAPEQFAIKTACGGEIDDGKGVMERFRHGAPR